MEALTEEFLRQLGGDGDSLSGDNRFSLKAAALTSAHLAGANPPTVEFGVTHATRTHLTEELLEVADRLFDVAVADPTTEAMEAAGVYPAGAVSNELRSQWLAIVYFVRTLLESDNVGNLLGSAAVHMETAGPASRLSTETTRRFATVLQGVKRVCLRLVGEGRWERMGSYIRAFRGAVVYKKASGMHHSLINSLRATGQLQHATVDVFAVVLFKKACPATQQLLEGSFTVGGGSGYSDALANFRGSTVITDLNSRATRTGGVGKIQFGRCCMLCQSLVFRIAVNTARRHSP